MKRSVAKRWCCVWIWFEAIKAVLTCRPGKPGESGDDNKGGKDDAAPASLEWERACPSLGCRFNLRCITVTCIQ